MLLQYMWCQRRFLRVPWTARRSNLKEINPEYSLEGLMLKLQYFGHLMQSQLIRKDPDAGKDWRQEEKGMTEDKMVGWHHQLNERVLFVIQLRSCVRLSATPSTAVHQVSFHHLPELAQTRVHRVGDAIQPSCPLSSPSPPAFSLSQNQGLF